MRMSRQDFRLIADTIRQLPSFECKTKQGNITNTVPDAVRFDALCNRFADALAITNPRFNRTRFLKACGMEVR
jgi:hypothetical protein